MSRDDRGVSSVQFLAASALGLVLFVGLANLVVVQYGKGALRSALEQGVRAGSVAADSTACVEKIDEVVSQLLGGRMSAELVVDCQLRGSTISATGDAVFRSWTPLSPDIRVSLMSSSLVEPPLPP